MNGRTPLRHLVAALVVLSAVAGCGSSSLSAQQLRAQAVPSCRLAWTRMSRIPTPTRPGAGARFIGRGVAALMPELAVLRQLTPPAELRVAYRHALAASGRELQELRSALAGLRAGNDPVVAIKTLQQQLAPLEGRAQAAWRAVGLPACAAG